MTDRAAGPRDLTTSAAAFARGRCAALHELDLEDHEVPCRQCRERGAEVYPLHNAGIDADAVVALIAAIAHHNGLTEDQRSRSDVQISIGTARKLLGMAERTKHGATQTEVALLRELADTLREYLDERNIPVLGNGADRIATQRQTERRTRLLEILEVIHVPASRSPSGEATAPTDRDAFDEHVGHLFASNLAAICAELCEGVEGARPSHPTLIRDVRSAALCVARSATFRRLAAQVNR